MTSPEFVEGNVLRCTFCNIMSRYSRKSFTSLHDSLETYWWPSAVCCTGYTLTQHRELITDLINSTKNQLIESLSH